MQIDVITLFGSMFAPTLSTGLVGKALAAGVARVETIDPRTFTNDVHRTVDDTPYGGGAGMVMKVEPLTAAIAEARSRGSGPVVMLTPQGRPLVQRDLVRWSNHDHLVLVAGRYEGFDERIRSAVDEEVSLGDFVLTGGEYGALVIIDGVIRLLPGTLGNAASAVEDSFSDGLLEHPSYTRPATHPLGDVPDVLMSGHHDKIAEWRRRQSLERTQRRRPDLIARRSFTATDRAVLDAIEPAPLSIAVANPPVEVLRDLLRLAATYRLAKVFLVSPSPVVEAALAKLEPYVVPVVDMRPKRKRRGPPPTRRFSSTSVFTTVSDWTALAGVAGAPLYGSTADGDLGAEPVRLGPAACLCFGQGVETAALAGWLPGVQSHGVVNDLPLLAAAAVQLERVRSTT